jgi:tellurite resistance protein
VTIRVESECEEPIRLAAAMLGRMDEESIAELRAKVIAALTNPAAFPAFRRGIEEARAALAAGMEESVAFLTGDSIEAIRRVSGNG